MSETHENRLISVLKNESDNLFVLSQLINLVLSGYLLFITNSDSESIIITIILIFSFFSFLLFLYWSYFKFTFKQDDIFAKTGKINRFYWILSGLLFSLIMIGIFLAIFHQLLPISISSITPNLVIYFLILLLFFLIIDFNRISRQPERPIGYTNNFFIKIINNRDPEYQNSLTSIAVYILFVIMLPILIINFLIFNDLIITLIVWVSILSFLYGGYWTGYGAYRSYRWLLGISDSISNESEISNTRSKFNQLGMHYSGSVFIGIAIIFYLLFLGMLTLFLELKIIQKLGNPIVILLTIGLMFALLKLLTQSISKTTKPQPWYSFLFVNSIMLMLFFMISQVNVLLSRDITTIVNSTPASLINLNIIFILFNIGFWAGIILILITISRHMQIWIWQDKYESNQLLSEINASLKNPKPLHLNLMARMGEIQDNKDTIKILMGIYQNIFEKKLLSKNSKKDEIAKSLADFTNNQFLLAPEWEVHAVAFDLAHQLLDYHPEYKELFFETIIKIVDHPDPMVRQAVLNLFGQIIQLDVNINKIQRIYPFIEQIYTSSDEQQKKQALKAFRFIITYFDSYRDIIYNFFLKNLNNELFGVATEIIALFQYLVEIDADKYYKQIYDLCSTILNELDHPGKLGAIRFFSANFPTTPQEGAPIINLFMKNLKDEDNAIGVRTNIIYTIGDLIPKIAELSNLLPDMAFLLDDEDPDVRTSIIQITTTLYPQGFIPLEILENYIIKGSQDNDYLVRLITIQSSHKLFKQDPQLFKDIGGLLIKRGIIDENQNVREKLLLILEEFNELIQKEWIESYILPEISHQKDPEIKHRLEKLFKMS